MRRFVRPRLTRRPLPQCLPGSAVDGDDDELVNVACWTPPRGLCATAPEVPAGMAVSRNSQSPRQQEKRAAAWNSTFHWMFVVSLHATGGSAVFDTPVAYGPRH